MPPLEAASPPNQIAFDFMSESSAAIPRGPDAPGLTTSGVQASSDHLPLLGAIFALGVVAVAAMASIAGTPLLLTLLASLAILGVFFAFGLLAGHVRIGDRLILDDIVRGISEGSDRGLLVARRDGSILYANGKLEELVGRLTSREISALDMAFGADLAAREAFFRLNRAADRGDRHGEDFRLANAAGVPQRILRVEVSPLELGRIRETGPTVLWTILDVTEERTSAAASRQALVDTLGYYDAAPVGLLMIDQQNTVRHLNGTLARWLGYPAHLLSTRMLRLGDVLSADAVDLIEGAWKSGKETQVSLDVDATREDGRLMPVRLMSRTARDGTRLIAFVNRDGDHGLGLDPATTDVRFARFFQSAPFGIASVSADGRITSANGAFARLMLDASGGLGKSALDVLCRGDDKATRQETAETLKRVLGGKAAGQPIEIALVA